MRNLLDLSVPPLHRDGGRRVRLPPDDKKNRWRSGMYRLMPRFH
jgi:hypothetical protein